MSTDAGQAPAPPVIRPTRLDDAADLERVRLLFERNGYPRSAGEVGWIYEPVAGEAPHAALAEVGDAVAALYATVPARFQCDGQPLSGAQSLDTMVDERFRGLGLFTRMARDVYGGMAAQGVSMVFGFPNGNSFHGFVSKLKWSSLDPVPFLFRPLDIGYALAKIRPWLGRLAPFRLPLFGRKGGSKLLAALPPASEVDSLWRGFSDLVNVARVRDHAFLEKRYARHPRARYRYRACYHGDALAGLAIYCMEEKHGGRVGYVMELMCLPGAGQLAGALLADTLRDMRDDGCNGALAWCFSHSPYHASFLRQGFLPLPTRLRPVELHFGVLGLSDAAPAALGQRDQWYLSYSDSDTV